MHWAPLSSSICMNSYALMPFYASQPTRQWGSFCAPSFSPGTSTSGAVWISDCSHLHLLLNTRYYLYCPSMLSVLWIPVFLPSALASTLVLVDDQPPLIESLSGSAQGFTLVLGLGVNNWLMEAWSRPALHVTCPEIALLWYGFSRTSPYLFLFLTQFKFNLYLIWEGYNTVTLMNYH